MRHQLYEPLTKRELVEILKARGYKRVSERLTKDRLVWALVEDDNGRIDERLW